MSIQLFCHFFQNQLSWFSFIVSWNFFMHSLVMKHLSKIHIVSIVLPVYDLPFQSFTACQWYLLMDRSSKFWYHIIYCFLFFLFFLLLFKLSVLPVFWLRNFFLLQSHEDFFLGLPVKTFIELPSPSRLKSIQNLVWHIVWNKVVSSYLIFPSWYELTSYCSLLLRIIFPGVFMWGHGSG